MANKKEAAVLAHRDPEETREIQTEHTLTTILPRLIRQVKLLLCRMLCILMVMLGVLGLGTWCEGWRPFWQAALIAGVSMMLAAVLLVYTEGGEDQ